MDVDRGLSWKSVNQNSIEIRKSVYYITFADAGLSFEWQEAQIHAKPKNGMNYVWLERAGSMRKGNSNTSVTFDGVVLGYA